MSDDGLKERRAKLRARCQRFLHGHRERSPADVLAEVAEYCRAQGVEADRYGEGAFTQGFEAEVAALLGMPAALFLPSGTMAQQIALRIWAERAGCDRVGFHATSHLEVHEHRAYARLHGLQAALLGARHRVLGAADLEAHAERLAAVIVELPAREIGGLLPAWDELGALKAAARSRGVRVHLDGARLWECGAGYGRSVAEVCSGADSVYVSFYKGLDGLTGCVLAGDAGFVAEAKVWRRRHGGTLPAIYPYVASARLELARHMPRFPDYLARARAVARALGSVDGVAVAPAEPHVNMMHVFVRGEPERLLAARDGVAERRGLWVAGAFAPADVPGWSRFELYVGTNALAVEDGEIREAFAEVVSAGAAG